MLKALVRSAFCFINMIKISFMSIVGVERKQLKNFFYFEFRYRKENRIILYTLSSTIKKREAISDTLN